MSSTVSVLKGCAGGYVGRGHVHPALLDAARQAVSGARERGTVLDGYVARCGDDLALVLLHDRGGSSATVRGLGREAFAASGAVSSELAQHGAPTNGGPVIDSCELTFEGRRSEPLLCFLADKAGPGAWNVHLYRIFGDPFNSPCLLDDPRARAGFRFAVLDVTSGDVRSFSLPDDLHAFLGAIRSPEGFVVVEVRSRLTGEVAATASSGTDPAMLVRCHDGFPSVGEALEAFAFPYSVPAGPGGGGPLMPVATTDETASRSDGPPRAVGLGFQVAAGRLVGPRDLLADRAFDEVRRQALVAADYLRRHGPFLPRPASVPAVSPAAAD